MPPGSSAPVGAPPRLNPYDFMGLVPDADAKPPATGPRLSEADAWKAVAKPPGAGAAPKPAWGLDDEGGVSFARGETPEQMQARRGFVINHLIAQGTGLAESLKNSHDTMSEADLAAYCDDYIRLASGRLDDPKVKELYDQAVADKPKLMEAYREAVFQKGMAELEREVGKQRHDATVQQLKVRPPPGLQATMLAAEGAKGVVMAGVEVASLITDLTPVLGQAKLLAELAAGRSLFGFGDELSAGEKAMRVALVAVPAATALGRLGARGAGVVAELAAKTGQPPAQVIKTLRRLHALEADAARAERALGRRAGGEARVPVEEGQLGRGRTTGGGPEKGRGLGLFGKPTAPPSGPESPAMRAAYLAQLESKWFRTKLAAYAKLTGKGPIDWAGLARMVETAEFREYATVKEALGSGGYAGLRPDGGVMLGMGKLVRKIPVINKSALQHELVHVFQEMTQRTLTKEAAGELPFFFERMNAEVAAHAFGSPAVVITGFVGSFAVGVVVIEGAIYVYERVSEK